MTISKDKSVTTYIPRPLVRAICGKIHKAKKYNSTGMIEALVKLADFIISEFETEAPAKKTKKKGAK